MKQLEGRGIRFVAFLIVDGAGFSLMGSPKCDMREVEKALADGLLDNNIYLSSGDAFVLIVKLINSSEFCHCLLKPLYLNAAFTLVKHWY
jgi:hypothetical protein